MPIDMVQELTVEVDSTKLLKDYLRLAIATVLNSHEELAVKIIDRQEKNFNLYLPPILMDQDKHFPVILIGGWFLPKKGKENSYFGGWKPWTTFRPDETTDAVNAAIQCVMALLKIYEEVWKMQFRRKFGDGYNHCFNQCDGSVEIGYEIRSCRCFPEILTVSLVHIYYGK